MPNSYSSYRDINQKWAPSIPDHWEDKRLKAVFAIRQERNNPVVTTNILSLTAKQGVVPLAEKEGVGGNKPKDDMTKYNVAHENDLLVNCMNVVAGSAGVSKYYGAISPVYYALYPREIDNVWYYHYIFRLFTFQRSLIGLGKGILMHESENGKLNTVRMRISMGYLGNVLLPVPPRDEQDKIVDYLNWKVSQLNRLINLKQKEIKTIECLKKSTVSTAVTKGLDPSVEMKPSGVSWLGSIPKHWDIVKLRQILSSISVKNHPELPLLSVVREQGVIIRDVEDQSSNRNYIPDDLSGYKVVKKGQFAMNKMKAWQGSYGVSDYTGIVSPAYFIFNIRFDNLEYFHNAIRSKVYVNFFAQSSDGIRPGQWDLQMDKMKEIPFIVPPADEQIKIVEFIKESQKKYESAIVVLTKEVDALEEMKTHLISDIVTGKIDIRNIEIPEYEFVDEDVDSDSSSEDESEGAEEQED
jgi:restriction modification system DNA specificity domain protein